METDNYNKEAQKALEELPETAITKYMKLVIYIREKKLYEWNASALITVWGDSIASNQGGLHDYSHREWSGLLKDLYYLRWKTFFEQKQQELEGKASGEVINFYGMEKAWAEKAHEY